MNCFNDLKSDLEIGNLPELKKIILKQDSLQNLNSLQIRKNKKLKTIVLERNPNNNRTMVLANTNDVIIESSFSSKHSL